jgi:hypothetical protein
MPDASQRNLEIAHRYLRALEQFATGDALAAFFAPEVLHQEFPNRLFAHGMRRDLAVLLAGAERGRRLLAGQCYEVQNAVARGEFVALEILWTGTLAAPLGTLPPGAELRAHVGVFLEFQNGKIKAQRNYDCYDPW